MIKTNTVYQIEKFYEGMKKYWPPVCSFKKLKNYSYSIIRRTNSNIIFTRGNCSFTGCL